MSHVISCSDIIVCLETFKMIECSLSGHESNLLKSLKKLSYIKTTHCKEITAKALQSWT